METAKCWHRVEVHVRVRLALDLLEECQHLGVLAWVVYIIEVDVISSQVWAKMIFKDVPSIKPPNTSKEL